jgi:hypothetical protein
MKSKLKFAVGFLTLAALTLGSAKAGYGAPATNPCSLLTTAQVSGALGIAVGTGKQEGKFDCEWDQPGWTMMRGVRLLLHVLGPVGNLTPVERFNTIKMPVPAFLPHAQEITKTPVKGVGDDAVYMPSSPLGPELTVKKGNSVFQVAIKGLPRDQVNQIEAKEKTLALDVLKKL